MWTTFATSVSFAGDDVSSRLRAGASGAAAGAAAGAVAFGVWRLG